MRSVKNSRLLYLALCAGVGPLAPAAKAVVTFGGAGYNSSAAPGNVDAFEGIFDGGYTGTPISSNMLVTAAHLFPGPTTTFIYDNGTTTATTYNVQVVATLDDLAVWEIAPNQTATFSLTAPIYTGNSELGSTVVDVGRGYQRGAAIPGGWSYGGGQGVLSWGTNTISAVATDTQLGTNGSLGGNFLQFDFDNESTSSPTYNPNEAMLTPFDSGGGAFIDVNGQYQLAGINSFTAARIQNGSSDFAYTVTDSTGMNPVAGTLDDTSSYYYNYFGAALPILTHTPESSFVTQVSSKQNFIGEADGTVSSTADASQPINNDGLFVAYSNMTTGDITGNGSVEVGSGTTAKLTIAPNSGTSEVGGLSISPNSSLDLTNNRIIIDGGDNPSTEAWLLKCLASGYNGGQWNGPGIDSSMAAASSGAYGLGLADANDSSVAGLSKGQVEIAYTLVGDANMDGVVNGIDFLIMATHFNMLAPQGWEDGDFNYDGTVNASDFLLLAQNYNKASPYDWAALNAFAEANGISLVAVPEPTALIPLTTFSLLVMARRQAHRLQKPVHS
jgi:hypothetical protein